MNVRIGGGGIAVDDGETPYAESLENFILDYGQALAVSIMPSGMNSLEYRASDKILVYYDAKQNAFPKEGETVVEELDAVLAVAPRLREASRFRMDQALALQMDVVITQSREAIARVEAAVAAARALAPAVPAPVAELSVATLGKSG